MDKTLTIKLTNQKAEGLLRQLEELRLIKVLDEKPKDTDNRISAKYRGIITKKEAEDLNAHVSQIRNEWSGI